ncbi:hypothetical protein GCM10007897_34880 [Sphingobium jiangsuense]|uniref:Uncharacterized protein n=1 Tax=Sphingobium jiangsuense TaxID=870476 RepID=A0A7W6BKZ0_9SPHN|nr:hypothetical protein [Sphingobium jiangsuense]MBB3926972.1 hypothetical protein [Sphingobium jiangsuense]GLT02085.1 hypothetical protein GCM10007897_34880 [Sphingobium jiangsuense]
MPYSVQNIGDCGGEGHELNLILAEDGIAVLHSRNPDTGETQQIVMLKEQWKSLLHLLLGAYGTHNCCYRNLDGYCEGDGDVRFVA